MAQFTITWEAPEFEYREKDISWYWITIIIAACIIAFSVWEGNFLFGLFIVIAEILVIMWGSQEPRIIAFTLTESEIEIGEHKSHSLKEFESWSAENFGDGWAEIGFNFHAKLKVPLKVLAPTETLEEIRKNLKTLLREVEHQTTLIEAIEKLVKF
jgi:hypothetical protein